MAVAAEYRIPHSQFLEWDQSDRDKAIWWHIRQKEACPRCGTREEEWSEDHNAYTAQKKRCRGCEVTQQTEASITEADGRGVHVVLKKRKKAVSHGQE